MSRQRDRLLPAAAFLALVGIGVLVLFLVSNAVDSGREALEHTVTAEVEGQANSQSASLRAQLVTLGVFVDRLDLDFEIDSENDASELELIESLFESLNLRSVVFLTDADGVITQGINLAAAAAGEALDRPGFAELLETMRTDGLSGGVLPVATSVAGELPNYASVYPIRGGGAAQTLRGTFVIETAVAADSNLAKSFAQLGRAETGEWFVVDALGTVIASTNPSFIGRPVPDPALGSLPSGLHRRDSQVQVFADVLGGTWRIGFVQDADEFDEVLAGPLQRVGLIVVVVFVAVGIAAFVALSRRLQTAREEEERLRRLTESQEEFISIVSHELRTPVAGVLGFLQTTMDHWDSMTETERFNALRRSASNARRLQGLTRDVLDSQAVDSGRMSYALADADLVEEVAVAVEAASALYPRIDIRSVVEVDSAPVVVDIDRIQQVLTNLLDNAAKVSPPNGTVEVRLRREGGRAIVAVQDDGPGLSPDLQDRVFDKFVRGRETGVTGTGLGLYISRQILEAHEGSIRVADAPDGGACFEFELPIVGAPVPQ
jgi:signal transduction histidine kinase